MDNPENIKIVVAIAYAVPSFTMSTLIVVAIIKSFKASFYRLYAVAAITDFMYWIVVFVSGRARNAPIFFPLYALLPKDGPLLTAIMFFTYYLNWVQYGTTLSLTLNRFSVIAWPHSYVKLWRKYFYHVVAIIFVYPLPLTYHIIIAGGYVDWNNPKNPDDGYRVDVKKDGTEKRNSLFMMIGSALLGILIVFMNASIATSLYRRRNIHLGKVDKEDTRDTEAKLFLLTCIMFSFTAITFVNQCFFYFLNTENEMSLETFLRLFALQHFAGDLHACSSPWFLLIMSRAVREELMKIVPFVGNAQPDTVQVFSQATSSIQPAAMPL